MKRKITALAAAALLFVSLIAVYFYMEKTRAEREQSHAEANTGNEAETSSLVSLTKGSREDVVKTVIINANGNMTFVRDGTEPSWFVENHQDLALDPDYTSLLIRTVANFKGTLLKENADLAEYGLNDPARGFVYFEDGTEAQINVGNQTPDGKYYYVTVNEENNVYLADKSDGGRIYYTLNNIIDRKAGQIDATLINFAEGKFRGKGELTMSKGYPHGSEYISYLNPALVAHNGAKIDITESYNAFHCINRFEFSEIVDLDADNLAKYGMDDPLVALNIETSGGNIHFILGDIVDDYIYFKYADKPYIYKMRSSLADPLLKISPANLMEKNLSYVDIRAPLEINFKSPDKDYKILPNFKVVTFDNNAYTFSYEPYINGTPVNETAYKKFYEYIKFLPWDALTEESPKSGDSPAAYLIYEVTLPESEVNSDALAAQPNGNWIKKNDDGTFSYSVALNFYEYGSSEYYLAKKDDSSFSFLVNKRQIREISAQLDRLIEQGV